MKHLTSFCLLVLAALSGVIAAPISKEELVDMSTKGYRLLDLKEGAIPVWKTEEEKLELLREGVRFVSLVMFLYIPNSLSHEIGQFDVTEVYDPEETTKPEAFARLASC